MKVGICMTRNIIKYVGLTLVIIGIVLVMKNLFATDSDWQTDTNGTKKKTGGSYSVTVSLVDKETETFLTGASLAVQDEDGKVISEWTTDAGVHLLSNLKNGTYTLVEKTAPEGYHLNEDGVSFEIKDSDSTVKMYNIAMTEEEIKMSNTTGGNQSAISDEVGVENTSSMRNGWLLVGGTVSVLLGIGLVIFSKFRTLNNF